MICNTTTVYCVCLRDVIYISYTYTCYACGEHVGLTFFVFIYVYYTQRLQRKGVCMHVYTYIHFYVRFLRDGYYTLRHYYLYDTCNTHLSSCIRVCIVLSTNKHNKSTLHINARRIGLRVLLPNVHTFPEYHHYNRIVYHTIIKKIYKMHVRVLWEYLSQITTCYCIMCVYV